MDSDHNVKVAVRIRPQVSKEVIEMCSVCTTVTPNEPQVWLGKDKAFTFDYVFDQKSEQCEIYDTCVHHLVEGCLEGYNATVLAYGQTGSGKTYTMGTGFDLEGKANEKGIIPRAVEYLFAGIRERQTEAINNNLPVPEFKINTQFLELYNEDIIDLLADERTKHSQIKVHEDASGGIYTLGATAKVVTSVENTVQCLKKGALSRSTASTQMNTQSSRSHAIFTLHIKQQRVVTLESLGEAVDSENCNGDNDLPEQEFETLTAKFHFVDLAGSERLKRTGATGDRQKEGISINSGLLALGNVISALGDKAKRATHVPYRDSKLTRLLQDSLGGNSRTLMIACISPSDRDFMETLNTLRYANRAKNIKNRVVANQDKSSQLIVSLRREIQQLQLELMDYKQGKRIIGEDGRECVNDMYHENTMLQATINNLKTRVKALQDTNERLTARNTELIVEKEAGKWISSGESKSDISEIIQCYLQQIEELRTKLIEMEETCANLRKQKTPNRLSMSPYSATAVAVAGHYDIGIEAEPSSVEDVLLEAKRDLSKMKKLSKALSARTIKEENESLDTNGNDLTEDNVSVNGEDVDDTEDSSNDESDGEDKQNESELELVALTNEITVKEKLICELEKSQRKLNTMRQNYEDKLLQLQNRIHSIEAERDQVLSKLGTGGNQTNEKEAKRIRCEYEKKINGLQSEMKKLQIAKKEHAQLMRNQSQYEYQLKQLKNDVAEMKKQKVRLLHKMKEEAQKHREIDLQHTKRIAQMTKQERTKDARIKNLEIEKNRAKAMLRRKDEEVNALKKRIKPMSDKVAGRIAQSSRSNGSSARRALPFSPKAAKQKWHILEQNISKLILNKQTISLHEKQMERFLHQRDQISHALEKAKSKLQALQRSGKTDTDDFKDICEEIDNCEINIGYLNQNINECQSTIMQIEDGRDENELVDFNVFLNSAQLEDVKYLFDKVLAMAVNQSLLAAQRDEEKKEFELKYKQSLDTTMIQESLLHHVLESSFVQDSDLVPDEFGNSPEAECASEKPDFALISYNELSSTKAAKARRQTKTPQELLFIENSKQDFRDDPMTKSLVNPIALVTSNELHRVPSAPSLKENQSKSSKVEASPSTKRKYVDKLESRRLAKSISVCPVNNPNNIPQSYVSRQLSTELNDTTPPSSPPTSRRNRDDNVFSRLTSGTLTNYSNNPDRGVIVPFTGKGMYDKHSPLVCGHVAEGHSRAVLSVAATNDVMFTGSKDCTAKIWDLHTGQEIQSLTEHPDSVVVVRYNEYNRLAFSVSKWFVKVWDPRENPARCIKILNSSGLAAPSTQTSGITSKGPELPPGENRILDIQLSLYGTTLFSTCANIVRVWDLRMFYCVGKLNTGHQAPIMCMCVEEAGVDNNLVITGSKDHYIKAFEVMEGVGGIHNPKYTCTPPHYDGIESLVVNGDLIFSASRDACIKKWDLSRPSNKMVQSLNQAHKDWILALGLTNNNNTLVSGCRSGFIKLWATDTCQLIGDIKAHSNAIHSIDTNASLVFTASADNTVGLWRWKSSSDPSPECYETTCNDL